ncbi:MAG: hypothetical protein K6C36_08980 [Clostridia bacterium]|nr:hypothetical protein [Clostridia bacterium]
MDENRKRKTRWLLRAFVAAAAAAIVIGGAIFMISGRFHKKLDSFDRLELTISGMRVTNRFELVRAGSDAELTLYEVVYINGEAQDEVVGRARMDYDSALAILNDCRVASWDGFEGRHPHGVLDGEMFTFELFSDGKKTVYAHGSENFPRGYSELRSAFYELLENASSASEG